MNVIEWDEKVSKLKALAEELQKAPSELLEILRISKTVPSGKLMLKEIAKLCKKLEKEKYGNVLKPKARDLLSPSDEDAQHILDETLLRLEAYVRRRDILRDELLANNPGLRRRLTQLQGQVAFQSLME